MVSFLFIHPGPAVGAVSRTRKRIGADFCISRQVVIPAAAQAALPCTKPPINSVRVPYPHPILLRYTRGNALNYDFPHLCRDMDNLIFNDYALAELLCESLAIQIHLLRARLLVHLGPAVGTEIIVKISLVPNPGLLSFADRAVVFAVTGNRSNPVPVPHRTP